MLHLTSHQKEISVDWVKWVEKMLLNLDRSTPPLPEITGLLLNDVIVGILLEQKQCCAEFKMANQKPVKLALSISPHSTPPTPMGLKQKC